MGALILGPLLAALLMLPMVAARTAQLAELRRMDAEVRAMLRHRPGQPAPAPAPIADAAILDAEAQVRSSIQF